MYGVFKAAAADSAANKQTSSLCVWQIRDLQGLLPFTTPWSLQRVYKGFTKGVNDSHVCWADKHCWISQRKVNIRL
jgi:hypothetical protein